MNKVEQAYQSAREKYFELGVDTNKALESLKAIPISLHCWQGDDVSGFETEEGLLSDGGIQATGNYPGKARNANELRTDIEKALSLIPGRHRVNLHAIYAETDGKKVDRNKLEAEHFISWIDWAKQNKIGIDFNGTFFSHPKASDGFTLSHANEKIRTFWIEHAIACRKIGEAIGKALENPCVTNLWIPDGFKDIPVDRKSPRQRLKSALDEIFKEKIDQKYNLDSLESKLFGIGSESYVVGSHEFYLGYAIQNHKLLCIDSGHFHPTENISDKISSVLLYVDRLLLHVSRGVRWDSDHVVILSNEVKSIAEELIRGNFLNRVHIGLDYFDASINRIAAWTIGTRNMLKALLMALIEPVDKLRQMEKSGDYTARLAMLEEIKTLPFGAIWDYYCQSQDVPVGFSWLDEVRRYEKEVLSKR